MVRFSDPPVSEIPTSMDGLTIKLEAKFHSTARTATFRPTVALKLLQEAMWKTGHHFEVLSTDKQRQYSTAENFPFRQEDFEAYHEVQLAKIREYGQTKILVYFTIISSVPFDKLKPGHLMQYLSSNNVWLREQVFHTPEVTNIGFMTLRRFNFMHRAAYKQRAKQTMEAYASTVQLASLPQEHQFGLEPIITDISKLPVFDIIKRTKMVKNPNHNKDLHDGATNRKKVEIEVLEIRAALSDKPVLMMLLMNISALDPWMIGRFIPDKLWQTDANLYYSYAMEHAVWFSQVRKIPIFKASVSIMNSRLNPSAIPGITVTDPMPTLLGHMERLAGHFENDARQINHYCTRLNVPRIHTPKENGFCFVMTRRSPKWWSGLTTISTDYTNHRINIKCCHRTANFANHLVEASSKTSKPTQTICLPG